MPKSRANASAACTAPGIPSTAAQAPLSRSGACPDQGTECLLTLGAREMQHHLVGADRSGTGQRLRQGPDRVVPHGENDDARLGDPGGRLVLGTNGQLEGLRDRLLAASVQTDVVALRLSRP